MDGPHRYELDKKKKKEDHHSIGKTKVLSKWLEKICQEEQEIGKIGDS